MDLEQKLGQLFIMGFQGETVDRNQLICRDIQKYNLGGVILFDRLLAKGLNHNNITSPQQLQNLTSSLQSLADTPLFICIDQEGGAVSRLKRERGFFDTVSAGELGRQDDTLMTASHSEKTAKLLASVGINVNFAPVVDLNVNPDNPVIGRLDRCFSSRPETVIQYAKAWIAAHRKHHVLSCLKHFPGHGSSYEDSHLGFVNITDTWQEIELIPFRQLVKDGFADSIMTGHLFHRDLDAQHPASLSPAIINRLLRQEIGYNGLVISDDLQMKSISDHYNIYDAVCMALASGVDMIIIGNNLVFDENVLPGIIQYVVDEIREDRLSIKRVFEAFEHVQTAKEKLKLHG